MKTYRLILWIMIGTMGLVSCVSKRKYLDMESAKLRAEERIRELTADKESLNGRIESLIADFEQMKQELLLSNAQKDQLIGNLHGEINRLKTNVQETSASVEEQIYSFNFEKRRLEEELQKNQQTRTALENRNKELESELNDVKGQLTNLRFSLDKQTGDAQRATQKAEAQTSQLTKLQAEVGRLTAAMKEKDETIERLTNNVNLLKKELGK